MEILQVPLRYSSGGPASPSAGIDQIEIKILCFFYLFFIIYLSF